MSQSFNTVTNWDTTFLIGSDWVYASYPRYMDACISFDERLADIKNESIRRVLKTIISYIEQEYVLWDNDKREIWYVEEDLVNYSQMFLYGLAQLYRLSNVSHRRYIVEALIVAKVNKIDYL